MRTRIAYLPLSTYPEAPPGYLGPGGSSVLSLSLGYGLQVSTFSVDIPQLYSPTGGLLIDIPGLARAAEDRSKAECRRLLRTLLKKQPARRSPDPVQEPEVVLGAVDAAAAEARILRSVGYSMVGGNSPRA